MENIFNNLGIESLSMIKKLDSMIDDINQTLNNPVNLSNLQIVELEIIKEQLESAKFNLAVSLEHSCTNTTNTINQQETFSCPFSNCPLDNKEFEK